MTQLILVACTAELQCVSAPLPTACRLALSLADTGSGKVTRHEQTGCKRAEIGDKRAELGRRARRADGCRCPRPWSGGAAARLRGSDRGRTRAACRCRCSAARGQVVSAAAAAIARRRRIAPQDLGPGDGGDRRRRRQHGLVHGPGCGLRHGGRELEARGRTAFVRARRRRSRLGRRHPGQGIGGGRRLSGHRQMDLRQRLRQCDAARWPQLCLRKGWHAEEARQRPPSRPHPPLRQVQGQDPRHVAHARPQGHGELHLRGRGPVRARGGDFRPRGSRRRPSSRVRSISSTRRMPTRRPSAR